MNSVELKLYFGEDQESTLVEQAMMLPDVIPHFSALFGEVTILGTVIAHPSPETEEFIVTATFVTELGQEAIQTILDGISEDVKCEAVIVIGDEDDDIGDVRKN